MSAVSVAPDIRPTGPADAEQVRRLGWEAFGEPASAADREQPPAQPAAGEVVWGAFLGAELVATLTTHAVTSWWGGVEVPTSAVASVSVALEHRGQGLLRGLFSTVLDREVGPGGHGAGVSTLYPTAAGVYRGLGYELVGSLDAVEVPLAAIGSPALPDDTVLRRATEADEEALAACYRSWASARNGPLGRTGPGLVPGAPHAQRYSGVTLAVEHGDVAGYLSWRRGQGYGPGVVLEVDDLLATSPAGYCALWRTLAQMGAAAGTVRLRTSGHDVARTFLPTSAWHTVQGRPYALRVVDLPRAVAGRRTPVDLDVEIVVAGDPLGTLDGGYRLGAESGRLVAERRSDRGSHPTFHPRGLALLLSGAHSCGVIRQAGLLEGPDGRDVLLDAAFGGHGVEVRDYF